MHLPSTTLKFVINLNGQAAKRSSQTFKKIRVTLEVYFHKTQ